MAVDFKNKTVASELCVFVVVVVLISCVCSCDREPEESKLRRVLAINGCITIIHCETAPDYSRQYAQQAYTNWLNNTVDPDPILIYACCGPSSRETKLSLSLTMSDEQSDIIGLKVTEIHRQNGDQMKIVEEYPVFINAAIGHHQIIPIVERALGQRKNAIEWEGYVERAVRDNRPPIYLSLPKENQVEVQIQIYDKNGLESQSVPLETVFLKLPSFEELREKGVELES